MNRLQRHGGAVLLVIGVSACQPPEPPVLAPAATAMNHTARQAAANDDVAPQATAVSADEEAASVALDHAGEVLVGQHMADLDELGPWQARGSIESGARSCVFHAGPGLPEGVLMRVDDDHVARFDLGQGPEPEALAGQPGPFGVRLGMPREEAVERLPASAPAMVLPQPTPLEAAGEYLVWQDPGTDLALGLELYEGKVVRLYWGISEAVELIEGCAQ